MSYKSPDEFLAEYHSLQNETENKRLIETLIIKPPVKDFDSWNKVKIVVQSSISPERYPHRGQIWWTYLGLNIGDEQDGKGKNFKRPVLVMRKLTQNLILIIPLTTKSKESYFYIPCVADDGIFRMAMLYQIRILDVKRFKELITQIDSLEFQKIKQALKRKIL